MFIFSDKDTATLSTPIKDVNQAKIFLLMLAENGLLYHPDDNTYDCIGHKVSNYACGLIQTRIYEALAIKDWGPVFEDVYDFVMFAEAVQVNPHIVFLAQPLRTDDHHRMGVIALRKNDLYDDFKGMDSYRKAKYDCDIRSSLEEKYGSPIVDMMEKFYQISAYGYFPQTVTISRNIAGVALITDTDNLANFALNTEVGFAAFRGAIDALIEQGHTVVYKDGTVLIESGLFNLDKA